MLRKMGRIALQANVEEAEGAENVNKMGRITLLARMSCRGLSRWFSPPNAFTRTLRCTGARMQSYDLAF